ncbi:MAG: ATP-binding protein [Planctomycetota bacterium]|jgi:hypothetical protein
MAKKSRAKSKSKAKPKAAPKQNKMEQMQLRLTGGEIEFPKKGNVMRLLGEVYEDIRDALGEFISNAEDAEASKVRIHLHGRSRIVIEDNGTGMPREEMASVPRRVGDSIRALQEGKIGEKGIGILGFQALADRCTIISRARGKRETYRLSLVAGNPRFRIAAVRDGLPHSGTEVVISGIRGQRSRVFAKKPLVNWLQSKYRQALQERRFRLEVLDGQEIVSIRPSAYQGEQFKIKPVKTRFGLVRPSLFISPMATNFRVGVTHKGRMVVHDVATIPEFRRDPWTSGKVQGEITADFCRQTTGRAGLVQDDKRFDAWLEAVRKFETPLRREIGTLQREAEDESDRGTFKRMNGALTKALREFEEIESLLARVQRTALGRGPRTGASSRAKSTRTKPGPAAKLLTKLPPRGFTWEVEDFDDTAAHLHSQYDRALNTIRINRLHPDYERESTDAPSRERYLVKLTTKELTLALYPGISRSDQLEKMVQLELCMNRNL